VGIKNAIFWDITLATCFHVGIFLGLFDPEDGGDMFPRKVLTFNGLHGAISQKTVLFKTVTICVCKWLH
jgi:hypothetical protein